MQWNKRYYKSNNAPAPTINNPTAVIVYTTPLPPLTGKAGVGEKYDTAAVGVALALAIVVGLSAVVGSKAVVGTVVAVGATVGAVVGVIVPAAVASPNTCSPLFAIVKVRVTEICLLSASTVFRVIV